jgi:organic radical activating enzyme
MRTETTTRTLYKFEELSDEAKEKALDSHRYTNTEHMEWWESTYEDAANVGIKIEGFDTGRPSTIDGTVEDTESTAHQIVRDHGEECETYKTAAEYLKERDAVIAAAPKDPDTDEYMDIEALDDKLDELGKEFTKSILEDYLIILRNELEYLESDEAAQESIEANGYEFTEDGQQA